VITCGLAEEAVTATEQLAVVGPVETREHIDAGLKVSVMTDEEKLTVPVGVVETPEDVSTTVAVTITGCPTTTVPPGKETEVEVERVFTVRVAVPDALLWTGLPA
jgi:hypothetical protein